NRQETNEIRRLARKQQEQRSPILSTVILKLIQELNVDALLAKQCAEKVFEPKKKQHDVQSLVNEAYALSLESGGVIPIEIEIKNLKKSKIVKLKPKYQENDMRLIVAKAQEDGISAHDALKQAGWIPHFPRNSESEITRR
ncbi:MAG: hypothetical protein ACRC8K_15225, partial [Waterburya sp.]